MLLRLIVAANTPKDLARLRRLVSEQDVLSRSAQGRGQLLDLLGSTAPDVVFVARTLLGHSSAEIIQAVRRLPEAPEVVVITRREDEIDRVELLAQGCLEVLSERVPTELLTGAIGVVIERVRDLRSGEVEPPGSRTTPRLSNFVSKSAAMQEFVRVVRKIAPSQSSLLISGETGVGKEWLARAIHAESPRRAGPFVAVNCGALPESLLESELFGHVEGAFTGASRTRRGVFELAHRGTIFLDEVGEMPTHLQVKLLHVLQAREIQRVGGEHPIPVDVRVVAATNRELHSEIDAGRFRRDLYYRLSVVALTVPPLRERPEDIPELVESYLHHFRGQLPQQVEGIDSAAMQALCAYDWPGNVRELINIIERALILCDGDRITLGDLPAGLATRFPANHAGTSAAWPGPPPGWLKLSLKALRSRVLHDIERSYLEHLLTETEGHVGQTAERAGLNPRSLYDQMRKLGLRKEDYRARADRTDSASAGHETD